MNTVVKIEDIYEILEKVSQNSEQTYPPFLCFTQEIWEYIDEHNICDGFPGIKRVVLPQKVL